MGEPSPLRRPLTLAAIPAALLAVAALVALVLGAPQGSGTADPFPAGVREPFDASELPGTIALDGGLNGAAFTNDNLWTHGDLQFAVWVDGDGSPVVGRRRVTGGGWRTVDLGALAGNPLGAPTPPDAHRVFAIAVDEQGFVHVAGNMHASELRYVRSRRPLDIGGWDEAPMVGSEETSVTYPAFVRSPDGALLFFYRDGGAGRGDVVLNRLDGPAGAWRRVATLIDGASSDESAYLQRVAVDAERGRIHLLFLWRAGDDAGTNRDVSYLASDDGGSTWHSSDGSVAELPVTHGRADVVARTGEGSAVLLNQGGMAVDGDGFPHAVFLVDERAGTGEDLVHVWQEAGGWRHARVQGPTDVAGRPALVGAGRGTPVLVWTERRDRDSSELRVGALGDDRTTGAATLARLPVGVWEPTFDSRAAAELATLSILLPLRQTAEGPQEAEGAVASWPLDLVPRQATFGAFSTASAAARGVILLSRGLPCLRRPPGERRPWPAMNIANET